MRMRYALEMLSKPGLFWADEQKPEAQPFTFPTKEDAESFLWQRDALVVMDATVTMVDWE